MAIGKPVYIQRPACQTVFETNEISSVLAAPADDCPQVPYLPVGFWVEDEQHDNLSRTVRKQPSRDGTSPHPSLL